MMGNLPKDVVLCVCDFETTGVDTNKDLPIEVGCVFVDHELNELGSYEALLKTDRLASFTNLRPGSPVWNATAAEGAKFHKISFAEVARDGITWPDAAVAIKALCGRFRPEGGRVVLTSDNVQFEWHYMRQLFQVVPTSWPFHYCGWDTSLLFEMTGTPEKPMAHRALKDAYLILDTIREARAKLRGGTWDESRTLHREV